MKRPRSQGEDPEGDEEEKQWREQQHDSQRSPLQRRFHSKPDRRGSSSYAARCFDRDREHSPRQQYRRRAEERDADRFDRNYRFDRCREVVGGGGREPLVSPSPSPRWSYGGERVHRSESFSGISPRREYPKVFRSEKRDWDRHRRDWSVGAGSSSSLWRRSSSWKEADARGYVGSSEDRRVARSKDSPSGDHSRSIGSSKAEESRRRESGGGDGCCSNSSSEMEEGELEPDPEPEQVSFPSCNMNPSIGLEFVDCEDKDAGGSNSVLEAKSEDKRQLSSEKKCRFDEEPGLDCRVVAEKGEEKVSEMAVEGDTALTTVVQETICTDHSEDGAVQKNSEDENEGNDPVDKEVVHEQEVERQTDEPMEEKGGKSGALFISICLEEKIEARDTLVQLQEEVQREERGINLEAVPQEGNDIDLEMDPEPEADGNLIITGEEVGSEIKPEEVALQLLAEKQNESYKEKGKSPAICESSGMTLLKEEYDATEWPGRTGFDFVSSMGSNRPEKANSGSLVICKDKDDGVKLEGLNLSLGLANSLLANACAQPQLNSPRCGKAAQSLPSGFRNTSDLFATSTGFSVSQTFTHNTAFSIDLNLMDNTEHSVVSHPKFLDGAHQDSNGIVLFHRAQMNANGSQHSPHVGDSGESLTHNGLSRQSIISGQASPSNSLVSKNTLSDHANESSSWPLFRSENCDRGQLVFNGLSVVDRILSKIATDPVWLLCRNLQEMSEQSVAYLKEAVCEIVINSENHGQLHAYQRALQERSGLTMQVLIKCDKRLLEILVTLKIGRLDYILKGNGISSTDLAEIFLNLKCQNLACSSILPVEDCECKVCGKRNGFCSACMCMVCSKFDIASNTCSWVGCDVCLHWCHTDCALQGSYIRSGNPVSSPQGVTELQFHCVSCAHPSEMFGFVKEVFQNSAKEWKPETLVKELQYARRIFSASKDPRGKLLCDVADTMLVKLESKTNTSEVMRIVLAVFAENDFNTNNNASSSHPKLSSFEKMFTSLSSEEITFRQNKEMPSSMDCGSLHQSSESRLQSDIDKMSISDELDRVVRLKQEQAKMYQDRADDARRVTEGLKRIALSKITEAEEEYASGVAKLGLSNTEEVRKQKLEELQGLERSNSVFFDMKMMMEADIHDLLLRMQTSRNSLNSKSRS